MSWRILVSFRGIFWENYIFAWWNIWVFPNSSFALRHTLFNVQMARSQCDTPPCCLLFIPLQNDPPRLIIHAQGCYYCKQYKSFFLFPPLICPCDGAHYKPRMCITRLKVFLCSTNKMCLGTTKTPLDWTKRQSKWQSKGQSKKDVDRSFCTAFR